MNAPSPTPPSLWARLRPEAARVVGGALCLAGTNALGFAIPAQLQRAIDALAAQRSGAMHTAAVAAGFIVLFAALQAVIRTASRVLLFNAGRNVEYRLRRDLFGRLTHQPPAFFQQHPTGDLMSRLTNDLSAVRMLFGPALLNIINTALVYGVGVTLLLRLSPSLTLFALLPFPVIVLFGRFSTRTLFTASRDLQAQLGTMSTALQEDLAGIGVIRSYALEDHRRARLDVLNQQYLRKSLTLVRARGLLSPVFALVGGLGTLVVLWMGGREVIAGRLTVGQLVAFNAYLVYLSWPTLALGWVLSLWQRGTAGWRRVRDLLVALPDEADAWENAPPLDLDASVRLQGLTIERDGRRVLDAVSLHLEPGKTLAVVGRTGGGKSTLADALLRFVEVPAGTVFLGGRDVTTMPRQVLRRLIGYAPQEAFLFSASVAENIGFGRRDAEQPDHQAIERAAQIAGLARDIAAFPDGYDTMVGERGITLSGGQRQRVALARAIAANPRVLLLDDSLSSVDAETEREILHRLRPVLRERTAIVISHRVAAIRDADEILVLDEGRVVERGTHQALVARGGVYASLYDEQLREAAP